MPTNYENKFKSSYLGSFFGWVGFRGKHFVALPTAFFLCRYSLVGHCSTFLPSRDVCEHKVRVGFVNIGKKRSFLRLVFLEFPSLLNVFDVHFPVCLGLFRRLLRPSLSPRLERIQEPLMTFIFIENPILELCTLFFIFKFDTLLFSDQVLGTWADHGFSLALSWSRDVESFPLAYLFDPLNHL